MISCSKQFCFVQLKIWLCYLKVRWVRASNLDHRIIKKLYQIIMMKYFLFQGDGARPLGLMPDVCKGRHNFSWMTVALVKHIFHVGFRDTYMWRNKPIFFHCIHLGRSVSHVLKLWLKSQRHLQVHPPQIISLQVHHFLKLKHILKKMKACL